MSITITTDIFCDGDDCGVWTDGTTGPRTNAPLARRNAKAAGWTITTRRDTCPACSEKEKASK